MRTLMLPAFAVVAMVAATVHFWETKSPDQWTIEEAHTLLTNSPWAQGVDAGRNIPGPLVAVYLATAEPVQKAEDQLRLTRKKADTDPSWDEYRDYLVENAGKYIILAVGIPNADVLRDNAEAKHMEEESVLKIGKRKYKIAGHFPPSGSDPFVRLVYPRDVQPGDKNLTFELYVPGTGAPYRQVQFALKDLVYHGQASY